MSADALSNRTSMPLAPDCASSPELRTHPEWPSATRGRSTPASKKGPAVQESEQGEGTGLSLRECVGSLVKDFVGHRHVKGKNKETK